MVAGSRRRITGGAGGGVRSAVVGRNHINRGAIWAGYIELVIFAYYYAYWSLKK
jgi:hypothetical protein